MKIGNALRDLYFNRKELAEADFRRSRKLFIFEGASATIITTLTTGAYLAGFASYMGANDQYNGIIGAIPALTGIIQVFSAMVFEKLKHRKLLVCLMCLFFRLLLGLIVFIPVIVSDTTARLTLLAVCLVLTYLAASFITPAANNWIMSLTPVSMRGRYFGTRDSYLLASSMIVSLVMGWTLDRFRGADNEYGGFLVVFGIVLVIAVINFFTISSVDEPPVQSRGKVELGIRSILTLPLKDKSFRKVIALFILWNIGFQIGGPFFAVYMVTGLKLPYTFIMVCNLLSSVTSVLLVRFWGRLADRRSWVFTTKLSIGLLAIIHFSWLSVNSTTAMFLMPLYFIISGAAWAGINISLFNIQFMFSPEEGRTVYLGFNAALGGLVGFSTTLFGSFLVGQLQNWGINIYGINIGNMQLLFGLSGLLLGACAAFIHYFIRIKRTA